MSDTFEWPVRVYWEDTDAGGVVYHATYVCFLERARTEWLRARQIDQTRVRADLGVQFTVVDMQIEWRRPALLDDALRVTARLVEMRGASFRFEEQILRGDELLVDAQVRIAAIDAATLRPRRLPDLITRLVP